MIKKEIVIVIFGVLLIVGLIGVVSAASSMTDTFGKMFDEFSGIFSVFFSKILGESPDSAMFFQRCLILLVVYGIIYGVLNRMSLFSGSSFLLFFTSGSVAVLGVKFLSPDFIQSILLPYAALGGSIAIFLPFLIYFTFVHTSVKGSFARRAAWMVFGVVFVAIFISGGIVSDNPTGSTFNSSYYMKLSTFVDRLTTGSTWGTGTTIDLKEDLFYTGDWIYIEDLYLLSGSTYTDWSGLYKIQQIIGIQAILDWDTSNWQIRLRGTPKAHYYKGMKISVLRIDESDTSDINHRYLISKEFAQDEIQGVQNLPHTYVGQT